MCVETMIDDGALRIPAAWLSEEENSRTREAVTVRSITTGGGFFTASIRSNCVHSRHSNSKLVSKPRKTSRLKRNQSLEVGGGVGNRA